LPEKESSNADSILNSILEVLLRKDELDFRCFKTATIYRRIEKRMGINQVFRLEDYLELIEKSSTESTVLCHELMIGVTRFYRDTKSFDALKEKCLIPLLKDSHRQNSIRFWSTGCSTGEETYTLAMLVRDCMEELKIYPDVKIFGTDINNRAIETAAQGMYPRSILADLPKSWGEKYFTANGEGLKVIESIRKMIIFSPHNIINNPPFNNMDLVVCRNLLIYLQPDYQQTILRNFHFSLQTGGYLMLGSSEDPGAMESHFDVVDVSDKIYRCKGTMTPREYARREPYQKPVGSTWQERSGSQKKLSKMDISKSLQEVINQELLPPGFIVDDKGDLIHTHGDMRPFMELPQGFMKLDIKRMLHRDVLNHVNSGLYRIKKDGKAVQFRNVNIRKEGLVSVYNIHIRPLEMPDLTTFSHISFEKVVEKLKEDVIVQDVVENEYERIQELEDELRLSNENLQSTIEELETSNEELQATNEELMASNEELQSTNEELQSVNEELYTVNSEYQNKIDQMSKLNIEFDELMEYSGLNSVFLDAEGHIKKFTSNLSNLINLLPSDVGRKIQNFSFGEFNQEISEVIQKVMKSHHEVIKTLRSETKVIHLVVRPINYDGVSGYVLTLFDLTDMLNQT
jgi:two-component system CheB/CheR fusion protein